MALVSWAPRISVSLFVLKLTSLSWMAPWTSTGPSPSRHTGRTLVHRQDACSGHQLEGGRPWVPELWTLPHRALPQSLLLPLAGWSWQGDPVRLAAGSLDVQGALGAAGAEHGRVHLDGGAVRREDSHLAVALDRLGRRLWLRLRLPLLRVPAGLGPRPLLHVWSGSLAPLGSGLRWEGKLPFSGACHNTPEPYLFLSWPNTSAPLFLGNLIYRKLLLDTGGLKESPGTGQVLSRVQRWNSIPKAHPAPLSSAKSRHRVTPDESVGLEPSVQPPAPLCVLVPFLQERLLGENVIPGALKVMGSTDCKEKKSKKEEFKPLKPLWVEQGREEPQGLTAWKREGKEEEMENQTPQRIPEGLEGATGREVGG
ncbi:PREDICTED: uncharacterized protein LOC105518874 [Colobus angolensis palliatus]|uniref:uncharacterized protein LOC105518874 n=1 Tax=Colobus angolensis palliatus TaxID=336983 RepID=UPI0005F46C54|nr:PREDICTED: uncharacterized protein LOC105518874 [Colobus angolensis palliatus]